jgi:hypothetical protein
MKIGVVFFHKEIDKIYKKEWYESCINSIKNQTFSEFDIYEIDYGASNTNLTGTSKFFSEEKINYADAMNFIISKSFDDGCDYVFNTNLDDYYTNNRIESQISFLKQGYDLVSSDFRYIDENGNHKWDMIHSGFNQSIKENLDANHNIIAHPSVAYSRFFWENNKYDPSQTPIEDLHLWKKSISNGFKFFIVPEILLTYRIHQQQVSNKNKN